MALVKVYTIRANVKMTILIVTQEILSVAITLDKTKTLLIRRSPDVRDIIKLEVVRIYPMKRQLTKLSLKH